MKARGRGCAAACLAALVLVGCVSGGSPRPDLPVITQGEGPGLVLYRPTALLGSLLSAPISIDGEPALTLRNNARGQLSLDQGRYTLTLPAENGGVRAAIIEVPADGFAFVRIVPVEGYLRGWFKPEVVSAEVGMAEAKSIPAQAL